MSERERRQEELMRRQRAQSRAAAMQAGTQAGIPAGGSTAPRMQLQSQSMAGRMEPPPVPNPALDAEAQRLQGMAANVPMMTMMRDQGPQEGPAGMREGARQGAPGVMQPSPDQPIPEERAYRTPGEAEAFRMGERMGAASIAGTVEPQRQPVTPVDEQRLIEAERLLMEYKNGKNSVDRRIVSAQQWWKLQNWERIEHERGTQGCKREKSATGWLFNCILGKHAEAMESFPEPVILPRMEEDKDEAEILSDIIPVILNINGFEEEYSKAIWQKFQEGTGAYYVGWDKTKCGGLGDIAIRNISLLNLFWEPGVEDIQDSENIFFVQLVNNRRLEEQYPQLKGKLQAAYLKPAEYRADDTITTDGKSVLVDWYYHKWDGDRKILHYCQFVGHEILYSTENNGETDGLYQHGEFPFVLDPLYPVHGSPAGYGLIDICADAQTDIDTLNQAMVQNAVVTSTPRFFIMSDGAINEDEFADWSRPFVHVNGGLGENSIREIEVSGIQGNALDMLTRKIEEIKFITGNSDVATGATPSGVTAASAIAALQEAHGRSSKDSTKSSYRGTSKIYNLTVELIRERYDMPRQFRILGPNGQQRFISYTNAKLQEQMVMGGMGLEPGLRKPVFDIEVRSERETTYSRLSQNELAVQFMQMGVFNPQLTDQSLMMLDMMDFRGKEELMEKVERMGTMQQTLMQVSQIAMALAGKYAPEIAMQLQPVLMQAGMDAGMGTMPQAVNPESVARPDMAVARREQGHVADARDRSNEAFMPE